ncbi:hypothetical protein BO223_05675 [Faecalibaculum rodentium]|uniref:Peptidase C39-like domain-containing protein n=1 Tax=Faecalibaculum rodentium TaxID=1702221 RepID=A0A1Q9YKN5_9FIRM|nr:hypothetical protein BO223_05675 [Faecalibaculum rodentium]
MVVCAGSKDCPPAGSFLLVTGYDPDGCSLQDPNRHEQTGMIWNRQRLAGQICCLWSIGRL